MLTAGDVEFEPETSKIYSLSNSTAVMVAGDASLQIEILQSLFKFVGDRIRANPQEWVLIGDIAQEYQSVYQTIKARKAEMRILKPLGLSQNSFIARQGEMSSSVVESLTKEILNFEMPAIEAIICGVDGTGAHMYVASNSDVACRDAIGFAAIGVGFWHANSQFMFAEHNRTRPLPETLLLTYAAKRRAEVAPGVGEGTDMFSIGPDTGSFGTIPDSIIKDLSKIYGRTRVSTAKAIKRSNQEVTRYVEQLAKAAAPQEQPTPTATPTEKTNGAEQVREEGDGTRKPN
jgi:hypothetical protein